jgi:signal peptidase I
VKGSTARRRDPDPPRERASARSAARRAREQEKRPNEAVEWIKSLAIAVVLFLVIRTFLVQAYTIPSGSMEDTLLVGDYLMANNAIYGAAIPATNLRTPAFREPRRGDIVVFRPDYNQPVIDVVKRVVGTPGDTIQMIDRVVHLNGRELSEPYVEQTYLPDEPMPRFGLGGYDWHLQAMPAGVDREAYQPTRDSWGPLVVPPAHFLLLGDNRDQSLDSRYMGFIPREVVRGRAMFIYYSIDPAGDRPFPRFLTSARWGRIGNVIR